MRDYEAKHVINGSHGEAWVDNEYVAEIIGLQAEIEIEFGDVNKARRLAKHKKLIGFEGTGAIKMNKVSSKFSKMVLDNLRKGKQTQVKLISNLDDPDAFGAERVAIYDAVLEKANLINWEAKELGEEEIPISFTDAEFLESID